MTEDPPYLTTKEVAELLRVKERKVYDLAAAGEIPHRRITGKLLFPSAEIRSWIESGAEAPATERPILLTGSHDPLLDWALRESGAAMPTLWTGSRDGLSRFADRQAAVVGLHIPEDDGWNCKSLAACGLTEAVLIAWAVRSRGLLLAPGLGAQIRNFNDLAGRRVVRRQPGAGAAALFEKLAGQAGLAEEEILPVARLARTESDAAAMVSAGEADAALGILSMARRFRLDFLPLIGERYDLLVDRRAFFSDPMQRLVGFARSPAFHERAGAMGGYALDEAGTVRWLSP
ncbi:MAG: substrate-binding domain-containing protein [Pikeienuella sp.]